MIEFHYFIVGFLIGVVGAIALVFLGNKNILPFKIPVVCGSVFFSNKLTKKGQLGIIEFKYFIVGFFLGLIGGLALVWLGTAGIIPFEVPLVCALPAAK